MLPTCKVFLLNLIEKFCYLLHNVFHYNLNERNTLNVFHLDFNETNMFYNTTILRTFFTFFRTIFFPRQASQPAAELRGHHVCFSPSQSGSSGNENVRKV